MMRSSDVPTLYHARILPYFYDEREKINGVLVKKGKEKTKHNIGRKRIIYELPGGNIEDWETPKQAAIRELREEALPEYIKIIQEPEENDCIEKFFPARHRGNLTNIDAYTFCMEVEPIRKDELPNRCPDNDPRVLCPVIISGTNNIINRLTYPEQKEVLLHYFKRQKMITNAAYRSLISTL